MIKLLNYIIPRFTTLHLLYQYKDGMGFYDDVGAVEKLTENDLETATHMIIIKALKWGNTYFSYKTTEMLRIETKESDDEEKES